MLIFIRISSDCFLDEASMLHRQVISVTYSHSLINIVHQLIASCAAKRQVLNTPYSFHFVFTSSLISPCMILVLSFIQVSQLPLRTPFRSPSSFFSFILSSSYHLFTSRTLVVFLQWIPKKQFSIPHARKSGATASETSLTLESYDRTPSSVDSTPRRGASPWETWAPSMPCGFKIN